MAQAVKQFGEVEVKVGQKSVHTHHVGHGDAQVTAVLLYPRLQRRLLKAFKLHAGRLKGLQVFMRHGANRCYVQLLGQVDIGRAFEKLGHLAR